MTEQKELEREQLAALAQQQALESQRYLAAIEARELQRQTELNANAQQRELERQDHLNQVAIKEQRRALEQQQQFQAVEVQRREQERQQAELQRRRLVANDQQDLGSYLRNTVAMKGGTCARRRQPHSFPPCTRRVKY